MEPPSSPLPPIIAAHVASEGASLANGTEESFEYHPMREWLEETSVSKKGSEDTPIFQASYTEHEPNGLIKSTSSTTNKMNSTFEYDHVNRLKEVTGDGAQSFDYDAIGNMTRNSSRNYVYPTSGPNGCGQGVPCAGPHAVKKAGNRTYDYDANGNMVDRDGREIRWNHDNQPEWIQERSGKWTMSRYDAHGEQVFERRSRVGPDGSRSGPDTFEERYQGIHW